MKFTKAFEKVAASRMAKELKKQLGVSNKSIKDYALFGVPDYYKKIDHGGTYRLRVRDNVSRAKNAKLTTLGNKAAQYINRISAQRRKHGLGDSGDPRSIKLQDAVWDNSLKRDIKKHGLNEW